ncbi:MAG: biotin/lipoyl-binding protein [Patescibacteria group bacterium]|nr:biotin/lipoyl-binding protein [Patescibacteria group bacterium]
MAEQIFKGIIKSRIIEVKFAISGKVVIVCKKKGDNVKKGELLATLDKKSLQMELDRQLSDFEKVKAEFEIFNLQKGEPKDDITKYLKAQKQAELNRSIKEVELAQEKVEMADLFSPIEGLILDESGLIPGIFITPSGNPIKILESNHYFFEMEIEQKDLPQFLTPNNLTMQIFGIDKTIQGQSKSVFPNEKGKFIVEAELSNSSGLLYGLSGEATII